MFFLNIDFFKFDFKIIYFKKNVRVLTSVLVKKKYFTLFSEISLVV